MCRTYSATAERRGAPRHKVDRRAEGDAEAGPTDHVERVVGADIDPREHHEHDDQPESDAATRRDVRRHDRGHRGSEDGVSGHEALTADAHVAPGLDVRADRRSRSLTGDDRLDDPLGDELGDAGDDDGEGEPVLAHAEREHGDNRHDDECAEEIPRPHDRVEPVRQVR